VVAEPSQLTCHVPIAGVACGGRHQADPRARSREAAAAWCEISKDWKPPFHTSNPAPSCPQRAVAYSFIHSFLSFLDCSLITHLLSTYYVLDSGEGVEGETGELPTVRELTRGQICPQETKQTVVSAF
jgi:hypothetical protein